MTDRAEIEPLDGKYYGTRIRFREGSIEIWMVNPVGGASVRERGSGWEPGDGMDHVEYEGDYRLAVFLRDCLNNAQAVHDLLKSVARDS